MRLIDADVLIDGRVENDPVKIAVQCAETVVYDLEALKKDIWNSGHAVGYSKGYDDGYALGIAQPVIKV